MAGGAVIGALRVVLGADTAALDKGLKNAEGSISKFSRQVGIAGAALAASMAAAMGGISVAVGKALADADKLGKLAQSVGIPVEELSKLAHAADLSGISTEEFGKSVVKLSKNMSEIAGGATNAASEAFKNMGIRVKEANGQMRPTSDVLSDIAAKFEGYADGANKTALATALFGKAGAAMIPMLNAGAAGLAEAKKEAEDLGLVIDSKTAKAAENFNDNLTRLHRVSTGLWIQVSAQLAPELERLSTILVNNAKSGNLAKSAAEGIASSLSGVLQTGMLVSTMWSRLGAEWTAFQAVFTAKGDKGISTAWNAYIEAGKETQRQIASVKAQFENDPLGNVTEALASIGKAQGETNKHLRDAPALASGAKNAVQSYLDSQLKAIAGQRAELAAVDETAGAKARLKIVSEGLAIATANNIPVTDALKLKLNEVGLAAENMSLKLMGANLIQQAKEPHELYREELENNRLALERFGATAAQIALVQQKTAEKYGATWQQVVPGAISGFQQLATEFGKSNSKIAKMAQALGIVEATINTYTGFTKALASAPPPLNYVAAAGVLAAGMAKVAAIKSQNVGGFATGGSFKVPGGIGGGDRVRAMVDLEPGEQVDVWRPGEGPDPRRGGGAQPQEITLNVAGFGRDFWAQGIEQINSLTSDGYRLKVA